jgi:hypothetical protein
VADRYRCGAGHDALHDDGKCHAAVFGQECGLELWPVRGGEGAVNLTPDTAVSDSPSAPSDDGIGGH